jgi:hypothetical protein
MQSNKVIARDEAASDTSNVNCLSIQQNFRGQQCMCCRLSVFKRESFLAWSSSSLVLRSTIIKQYSFCKLIYMVFPKNTNHHHPEVSVKDRMALLSKTMMVHVSISGLLK